MADITLLSADLRELSGRLLNRINRNYHFIVGFSTALLLLGLGGILLLKAPPEERRR